MKNMTNYETWFSLIITILLAIMALGIIFAASGGLFTMYQGLTLTLYILGIITLLMIYLRVNELRTKK